MSAVVFLLGAGASYPYGVPMMSGFYASFRELLERRHPECFSFLSLLEQQNPKREPDLETLLTDTQFVMDAERGLATLGAPAEVIAEKVALAREMRGYLEAFIVDRCERFDPERAAEHLEALLSLREYGPVWIFSTNYDRVVEHSCDVHGITLSDGFGDTGEWPVADWTGNFNSEVNLVKLHGSVNWYVDDPGGRLHRLDRGYALPSRDFRLVRGDEILKPLLIIPTLEKETLGAPYVQLSMTFTDVLREAKVLLITGTSLRDRHLREFIRGRLPTLRVVMVSPSASSASRILGDPGRTHSLEMGFAELMTVGRDALHALVAQVSRSENLTDDVLGAVIEEFIRSASADLSDDASIVSNPELHRLWNLTKDKRSSIRAAAISGLIGHSHPAITRRLRELATSDEDPAVRVSAITSLFKIAGEGAIETLRQVLASDKAQECLLEAALALLGLGNTVDPRPLLQDALEREDLAPSARHLIEEAIR